MKEDHADLKEHILDRLDALDEKSVWCLSKGQQGASPLSDRVTRTEEQKEVLTVKYSLFYGINN